MSCTKNMLIRILAIITYIGMVAVNALANILPINGITTGEVSNLYPNLFAPTGITFAIWGVIYFLLALYSVYQLGFFQKNKTEGLDCLLNKIGVLFSISSIANIAWIFSWHYDLIPLTMVLMLVILSCLILIALEIKKYKLSQNEILFIKLPFSVYFGWITVATIANATTLLVYLGWNGFGIGDELWTIIILFVGMIIGVATAIKFRCNSYTLVFVWAYTGIFIKHVSSTELAYQYPTIVTAIIVCITCFLAAIIYITISKKPRILTEKK
ncbi:MAG: lantibiotic ABC transporter permease [Clostridiales bacterium GWF2_38_85]|nr:MAG: lantibiotic ABC transporter permease [Clostridiales bacterium GWF2_38_85]HBL83502.1 lantibiotic ABC transporter permease [Clostridiales bacterium]